MNEKTEYLQPLKVLFVEGHRWSRKISNLPLPRLAPGLWHTDTGILHIPELQYLGLGCLLGTENQLSMLRIQRHEKVFKKGHAEQTLDVFRNIREIVKGYGDIGGPCGSDRDGREIIHVDLD